MNIPIRTYLRGAAKGVSVGICSVLITTLHIGALYATGLSNTMSLTVEAAAEKAVRDNPGLAKMQARFEAMSEMPSQKGSLPDPKLMLGAMNFPTDSFDRAQEPMTQLQVGVSQMIPFPGKLNLHEEAAEFLAKAAFFSVAEMQLKLVSHVTQKWWQVFYIDRTIETIEANQALLRQFIEVAKTKYETGKGLQQDVLLSQLELSKLIDKKITVESLRRLEVIQLNVLMAQDPQTPLLLSKIADRSLPAVLNENELYQLAATNRPLLQQKAQSLSAAGSRLKLAKRNHYPDFNISVVYGDRTGDNSMATGGARSDMLSMQIGITIPIYAGNKQSKAVKQSASEFQIERFNLLDEKSKTLAEISSGVTGYRRAGKQLSLFESGILPQARQTVRSMLAGYQVNQVDFLNLVRSQITLFNYELQYWKVLAEAKQSLSKLRAAVGEESIYE